MRRLLCLALLALPCVGQTSNTAARNPRYLNANVSAGTSVPESCTSNQIFIKTDADSGSNLYACVSGSFVAQAGGGEGTGDVTAASNIGKGQVAVGSDGAKAIEPSTLDGIAMLTKGVMAAATAANLAGLFSGSGPYLCTNGTQCAGDGTGTDDQTATEVALTPVGDVAAETVQAAIEELDTEKSASGHTHSYLPLAGGTMTGAIDLATYSISSGSNPADAGVYRMSNNENLCWEAATPGTDLCLYVGTDNEFHLSAPLNIGGTGGPILLTEAAVTEPAAAGTARLGIETDHLIHVFANGQADKTVAFTDSNITGTAADLAAGAIDWGGRTSFEIPNGASPTVDAAGEVAVDTTTDQFQFYGGAKRALPSIQSSSLVIAAPADTDDLFIMKAPYAMTILTINGIVGAATNVVGQLQECSATGTDCADLDSDITFDTDGAADDGTLTDSAIASGAWIKFKTTSVSGTPGHLAVTFTFRAVAD